MKRIMDAASTRPSGLGGNRTRTPRFRCRAKRQKGATGFKTLYLFPRRLVPFTRIAFTCEFQRPGLVMAAHTAAFCSQAGKYQSALFPMKFFKQQAETEHMFYFQRPRVASNKHRPPKRIWAFLSHVSD